MPNWCYNTLEIKLKSTKQKENFLQLLDDLNYTGKSIRFDFNKFVEYPKEFKKLDDKRSQYEKLHPYPDSMNAPKDGYNQGGYEWCCSNWGTKWNACDCEIQKDNSEFGYIIIEYNTAWAPPVPVLLEMSKKYHGIKFKNTYQVEGYDGEINPAITTYNGKLNGELL